MLSSKRHDQALQFALRRLQQPDLKPYIYSIYLYGSCARGTQKYDSDVDLFLFLKEDSTPELIRKIRIEANHADYTLPEVEVHVSTSSHFSACNMFNRNLEKEAIKLWEQDQPILK